MGRSLAFPLLLIALAVGGFLFVRQAQSVGPESKTATQAETEAATAAAATDFGAAQAVLLSWFADHDTYAGVTLPPAYAVAVVRLDELCAVDFRGLTPKLNQFAGSALISPQV